MEFDNPEVKQKFPGLYAERGTGDEEGRNFLSVKKKKDKDRGYKTFEEDGSGASCEDVVKVSSRLFKFGISSSKAASSKPVKVKLFGIELKDVLRRNPSLDPRTPAVPKFLMQILIHVEEHYEPGVNFYKGTSHFKSKIHQARHLLNYGQELTLGEPQIAAGLVKMFLRELPSHILGSVMESKLEETKPSEKKAQKIQSNYKKDVPDVNKAVFERLVLHMEIIGIDITPLLRVSQRALTVLKPVMCPLSIEDELKVEEARLARMHLLVAKATESKDKCKTNKQNDQEKLWEAQRNVTQLKRKLRQITSARATEIKDSGMNLEERRDDNDTLETKTGGSYNEEGASHRLEQVQKTMKNPESVSQAISRTEEPTETDEPKIVDEAKLTNAAILKPTENVHGDVADSSRDDKALPGETLCQITVVNDLKNDQILEVNPPLTQGTDTIPIFDSKLLDSRTDSPKGDAAGQISVANTEPLLGEPLDDTELQRLQQEWKESITEQLELLRVKDEVRRRIRDEHKQIKMIQMVRNHKSRLASMKPAYQDPLEKINTEKLRDVLQRLIESNAKLTQDNQILADKVFDEKMSLVNLRASNKKPLTS